VAVNRAALFHGVTSLAASNACETPPLAGSGTGGVVGSSATPSSRPHPLLIEGVDGERAVGPEPRLLVLHPAAGLHQVGPVAAGERLVAFGWVQSRVRDAARLTPLFDLHLWKPGPRTRR